MIKLDDIVMIVPDTVNYNIRYFVRWKEAKHAAHNGYFMSATRAQVWAVENKEYLIAEWERSLENILLSK